MQSVHPAPVSLHPAPEIKRLAPLLSVRPWRDNDTDHSLYYVLAIPGVMIATMAALWLASM